MTNKHINLTSYIMSLLAAVGLLTALPQAASAVSVAATLPISSFATFSGEAGGDEAGRWLVAGDLNGDGYEDMVVSAHDDSGGGPGAVYVLYGSATTRTSTGLSSNSFVKISGEANGDRFGISLAMGDINGDNYDDLLIGADKNDDSGGDAGAIYLIYGGSSQLTTSALTSAVEITGEAASDQAGFVAAGDVNDDGYDDMIIGAGRNDDGFLDGGAVYLIYGQAAALSNSSVSTAVEFTAEAAQDSVGSPVVTGDFNNDGFADILISAAANDDVASGAGAVYLLYGKATAYTSASLSTAIQFSGEAGGDRAGYFMAAGDVNGDGYGPYFVSGIIDINGDGYDDLVASADLSDDGGSNSGAVYLIYGQAGNLSSANFSTAIEFTGETASDYAGTNITVEDVNGDGYADIFISAVGNDDGGTEAGSVYMIYGQSTTLSAQSLTNAALQIASDKTSSTTGKSLLLADLNNDNYNELLFGAPSADSSMGIVYLGYMALDADYDTVLGDDGLLLTGTDCNDSDDTVSANQTYFADTDADTLGDPDVSTSVCSATPPEGYVTNTNDTNDTIPNNGVEIDGDEIDNDGDGEVDEVNTLAENGAHPYYSTLDADDATVAATAIATVTAKKRGDIKVTYADHSVYRYDLFDVDDGKKVEFSIYEDTAYALVLHPKGKNIALVNLLTGEVLDKTRLSKSKTYGTNGLQLLDVRIDDTIEAVVTSLRKTNSIHLSVVRINLNSGKLKKYDSLSMTLNKVDVDKTLTRYNTIRLRENNGTVLSTVDVSSSYYLSLAN